MGKSYNGDIGTLCIKLTQIIGYAKSYGEKVSSSF